MTVDPADAVGVSDGEAGAALVDAGIPVAVAVAGPVRDAVDGAGVDRVDRGSDGKAEVPRRVVVVRC